jgi:RimJ/RimL family protein N-acetyltransferase
MHIKKGNFEIRPIDLSDADILCRWWNDGEVMKDLGALEGINISKAQVIEQLRTDPSKGIFPHMIVVDNNPIGQMHYGKVNDNIAEIVIEIGVVSMQNKGYGTMALRYLIDEAFHVGYQKIQLHVIPGNSRAIHVYERKLGFKKVGMDGSEEENNLAIVMELCKEKWGLHNERNNY